MSTAVGTTGTLYRDTNTKGFRHGLLKGKLHGRLVTMPLPAEESSAVVGEGQLVVRELRR